MKNPHITIKNLHEHILSLAQKYPRKAALVAIDQGGKTLEEIPYAQLPKRMETAAAYLAEQGLKKGDKVALAFGNSIELVLLSWAAWGSGIVTVPMDTKRDTGEQYQYKLKLNDAKLLLAQRGALKNIAPEYLQGFAVKEFSGFREHQGRALVWEKGLDHLALILFTSGTTGHPKGAKLSLENLIVNADSIREWLRIDAGDTFLVNLPLHHINSTTFCLSTLLGGGTIAIPPGYSNSHFWRQMAGTGATVTSIVQSILSDQLDREKEYAEVKGDIRLSRIQIGSAPVVASTALEFRKKFGIPLYQGYGQTETALRVTGVPMGLPEDLYEKLVEENSIGTAMPWADLQIAGKDGQFLGENGEGELVVKGPAIMEGYVGGEPAFRGGYFQTGDVGFFKVIDGKKFYFLKGRNREIIIKGGVNISPVYVENHLKKISGDIDQVYCIGVPDARYGEEIAAAVCWKAGRDEERAMRRLKCALLAGTPDLSAYETPKFLVPYQAEDLPLTSTGKVQRTVLKAKIPRERFESLYDIVQTPQYRFSVLDRHSPLVAASHALYNQAWKPLIIDAETYEKNIPKQWIITAESGGNLAGQIALIRTDLSGEELLRVKYAELLAPNVSHPRGKALVCISICGADYKPKPVPAVARMPDETEVEKYLPDDPVFKFHQKQKGGLSEGAHLVGLIRGGRPEDKSSLGYTMLLKYPEPVGEVAINAEAAVSSQLIEVVLLIASDLGIKDVYAYSRPGGLASYLGKRM